MIAVMGARLAGKYAPLTGHLAAATSDGRQVVELSFAEIADLVGGLPASAYEHRAWWANGLLSQQAAWHRAGWQVDFVSIERRHVRFVRHGAPLDTAGESQPATTAIELPIDDGTPALDVRVRCVWRVGGEVGLSNDKLVFPRLPRVAAIYRLTFANSAGRPRIYIGETNNLRRRAGNYRNPGPTQQTSQRLHDELVRHLASGGTVSLSVAIEVEIETNGQRSALPLARKTARVLAEHAALALAYVNDVVDILNADRGAE
ncbi:hypothetical protein SK854_23030 [Lentzea sp. BCCO 10_0061]|uniref:DUF7662 domain-containing protein n=1 Tax=Lentzea sokolovensis TaxID=3095429 RepID=A0ABU4UZP2_9PSEU|nr:hypothetical protein [Lentzea sp. BCCO 10_0061]MDX8145003.1 hypothetical protein [Lentzea sp. BCCO 10_0061]